MSRSQRNRRHHRGRGRPRNKAFLAIMVVLVLVALAAETGSDVTVAEVSPDGVRLAIAGDPVPPPERGPRQAELRALCLARLRSEGLLEGGGQGIASS